MKSLPSILTLGNLSSGMLAVIMAIHGEFALAVTMIWVAMFFDLFDGYAARKLHCEGSLAKRWIHWLMSFHSERLLCSFCTLIQ